MNAGEQRCDALATHGLGHKLGHLALMFRPSEPQAVLYFGAVAAGADALAA
jgi:hypothetical protein